MKTRERIGKISRNSWKNKITFLLFVTANEVADKFRLVIPLRKINIIDWPTYPTVKMKKTTFRISVSF